jgi:hypothetical protein
MPGQPHIRLATPADAEPLAALAERTFRDTFADDNAPADMDAYVRNSLSLARIRAELADDDSTPPDPARPMAASTVSVIGSTGQGT